ncbi:Outer membrane lipoprotein omp16 precursor [hydrothermal vent metagenome]|uniref:Outer membrane lipoprotein omp16 n=1 Tax=hydrothermal vent metagenome TaxID=652676 RepID=A0A1W1CVY3_9ZZZZ
MKKFNLSLLIVTAIAFIGLNACASKAENGALIGAGTGALLGQAIGGNRGSTIIGAGLGAIAGATIGENEDRRDGEAIGRSQDLKYGMRSGY